MSGACCNGTICTVTLQSNCGGAFQGANVACGTQANPTTCCPANFDHNDGLTISDVFSFLNAWFFGNIATDFNMSGSLEVQDIFDFLNAWFAGC